jgi:hypothetical protein
MQCNMAQYISHRSLILLPARQLHSHPLSLLPLLLSHPITEPRTFTGAATIGFVAKFLCSDN